MSARPRIVVLDDYENALRDNGDWKPVEALADVTFHNQRLRGEALMEAIRDADGIVLMRDRTPFRAELLAQLPKLRFFAFTGVRNTTMDLEAFKARGIPVTHTAMGSSKESTSEQAWALIFAAAKRMEEYMALLRKGGWRDGKALPLVLAGHRLGLIGLGGIGKRMAVIGNAIGMEVVAWSPNMTAQRAAEGGAKFVPLEELLRTSKVVSLHLVPSEPTRKLLNAERLAMMGEGSILVNTARSALIDMEVLPAALDAGRPGIAALDVFDDEPLTADHALLKRKDVVLTPHLGFVNDPVFSAFAPNIVENVLAWLQGKPQPRLMP